MNELRKFLIFLRRQKTLNAQKFTLRALAVLVLSVAVSIVVDMFLSHEWYFQTLRAFLAITVAFPLFSLGYLFQYREQTKKTLREELSYKQRINASIILGFIIMIVYGLFIKPNGILYTTLSGITLSLGLAILTFIRPTTDEYIMYAYEIEDVRDKTADRLNETKIKERKKKQESKKKEKENPSKDKIKG